MRSRRTSASVTPVAGGKPSTAATAPEPASSIPKSIWDELEGDGDESSGALEQKRVGERDVRDERREHDPHFGDGGDVKHGFP